MSQIREWFGLGPSKSALAQENQSLAQEVVAIKSGAQEYVREGMMVALSVALEDRGWLRFDQFDRDDNGVSLSFGAVQAAAQNGAALVQANPIMQRATLARTSYVWGNGVRIDGQGVKKLLKRRSNKRTFLSEEAVQRLQFTKTATGNLMILIEGQDTSFIPFHEIKGGIYSSEDPTLIQYFYREWKQKVSDFSEGGGTKEVTRKMFYPNMDYEAPADGYPPSFKDIPVYQNGVIRHVAPNRLVGSAWGSPDLLAGIFYASEHKELIEAADAIYRAQSQYAVQYKTKTRKALESVAAQIAAPAPIDPRTGEPAEYGQTVAFGDDIEMQLMTKIGAGIDFTNFDPIAALASVSLGVPLDVVLGKETASLENASLPFSTLQAMKMEQRFWSDVIIDVLEQQGAKNVKVYWPKINPDPTHRQVQSIAGAVATKTVSPEEVRIMLRDTFGTDWEDTLPDPKDWEPFNGAKVAPGSTEVTPTNQNPNQPVTPGQGQAGKLGKLADGSHELRDAGLQDHTQK